MKKFYLVLLVLFLNLFIGSLRIEAKTEKKVVSQSKGNKIDYSKIEWRTREELKANLVKELPSLPVRSAGASKFKPDYPITTASPLFDTGGYTYFDYAANERLPRQIALSALGHVHIDWTKGYDATSSGAGKREVAYASFFSAGARVAFDEQVSGLGEDASKTRGGYTSLAVLPDGKAICCYHHAETVTGKPRGTWVSIEGTATVGDWLEEIHAPDSVLGMKSAGLYPACAGQKVTPGDTLIVHVVSVEFQGGNQDFVYARGRGLTPVDFVFSPGQRPDSSDFISVIVVASRKSNKVAMVYVREKVYSGDNSDADVFYIESTNGGRDWVNGFNNSGRDTAVNVTKYAPGSPIRATGDLSAVYDEDDSLHIVWVAPLYNAGLTASECYIYHWSKATGIDQVADGIYLISDALLPSSIAKNNLRNPQIGVHDGTASLGRKNYLYVTWNQFGPGTTDVSDDGILNGEIYVNASSNAGNTWGSPVNITNSQTPGCDRNCDSDVYPSLAERVNDTLHISYINDKEAGRYDQGDGEVLSPVLYYKYPAYQPAAFNGISVSPPYFDDPVANISIPDLVIDTIITITNVGNQTLTIDSVKKAGVSPWLKLQNAGFPDAIPEGGAPKVVACTLNGTGLGTATYVDTIVVYNNSNNSPTLKIPVHFVVTDCGYFRRNQLVATVGDLKLKASNTSNLADQDLLNGFYLTSVGRNFLFDGSAVFTTRTTNGDTVAMQDILGNYTVHPLSDIDTQTVTFPDSLTFAQALAQQRPAKAGTWHRIGPVYNAMFLPELDPANSPWPGPWFKYTICQTWWIKVGPNPRYVLWFKKLYKSYPPCWWPLWPGTLLTGNIYAGSVIDWDIPSDTGGVLNNWGNNDTLKFCWLRGDGPGSGNFFAATAAMVDTGVHIGNPNGFWAAKVNRAGELKSAFDPQEIFLALSDSGFNPKDSSFDPLAFTPADRNIMLASACFDTTADTIKFCQALVVSELGYDSLKTRVEQARRDMRLALPSGCTHVPGDVNGDNCWTLPDIVQLVSIVFKSAPKPTPLCRTDCNGSGGNPNLSDITYLLNKVLKSGPNPVKIEVCCKDSDQGCVQDTGDHGQLDQVFINCTPPDQFATDSAIASFDLMFTTDATAANEVIVAWNAALSITASCSARVVIDESAGGAVFGGTASGSPNDWDARFNNSVPASGILPATVIYAATQELQPPPNVGPSLSNGTFVLAHVVVVTYGTGCITIDTTSTQTVSLNVVRSNAVGYRPSWQGPYQCCVTPPPANFNVTIRAFSPVNLVVTDPVTDSIGLDSTGGRPFEIFNSILTGSTYDTTQDANNDGENDVIITIPVPYNGPYQIRVVPTDTGHFSLDYQTGNNQKVVLGNNVLITNTDTNFTYGLEILPYLRGDANKDRSQNLTDIIYLVNYLFKGGARPDPLALGNANCDLRTDGTERVDLIDVVYMVNYVFKGGPRPCS